MVITDRQPRDDATVRPRGLLGRFDRCSGVVALAMVGSRILTVLAYLVASTRHIPSLLRAWDAGHYLRIAAMGYPPALNSAATRGSDWAFFPLFPIGLRGVHQVTSLSFVWSGLLLNTVADVVLAVALWRLSTAVLDRRSAMWANVFFWLFPGSAVLSMNYSEALFLAFAALSLWFLAERRWLLAGVTAALAWSTRPAGAAVAAACLVAAIVAIGRNRQWRALMAPILAPLGLIAFLIYSSARVGHWDEWLRAESAWHQTFDFSTKLPAILARSWSGPPRLRGEHIVLFVGVVFFVAAICIAWRQLGRLPAPLLAYFAVLLVLTFGSSHVSAKPRFLLVMLPLFFALGSKLRGRTAILLAVAEGAALPVLLALYVSAPHYVP
jgi:hypothetical protein